MAVKYKRQKDGRFQTKVWDGTYKEDNSKRYIPIYSTKSSADLEKQVEKVKRNREEGNLTISSDMLFLAYARDWLLSYKSVRETGTKIMYNNIIEKHLIILDLIKITNIKRIHFQSVINNALVYPRTFQQISITFRQIIKSAISDKLLPVTAYDAICSSIDLPKYIPSEKRALTVEEKAAISKADFTMREKAFILTAYGCGLRRGEILALTVFDISIDRAELTVNKAVAFNGNTPYIKGTKSINGTRILPIPPFLIIFLKDYIKLLSGTTLITKLNGDMMTKSSYDTMWASIISKLNLAAGGSDNIQIVNGLTAHVFRHNYCANLCYQMPNISIKKIAQLLGDTEKMVLEVYNHILDEKESVQEVVSIAITL